MVLGWGLAVSNVLSGIKYALSGIMSVLSGDIYLVFEIFSDGLMTFTDISQHIQYSCYGSRGVVLDTM